MNVRISESVRSNACVHRLEHGLYFHSKEFWGNGFKTHVNSNEKIPSFGKKSSPQRRIEPTTMHQAGQLAQHTTNEWSTWSLFHFFRSPQWCIIQRSIIQSYSRPGLKKTKQTKWKKWLTLFHFFRPPQWCSNHQSFMIQARSRKQHGYLTTHLIWFIPWYNDNEQNGYTRWEVQNLKTSYSS